VFPWRRQQASAIAIFGAESNPFAGAVVLAGAAGIGLPVVGCDFHGPYREKGHWLLGDYPEMVTRLNAEVSYRFLDPEMPAVDLPYLLESRSNAWVVVLLNCPARAQNALLALVEEGITAPVLLMLTGPGGLVVDRHADPARALESAMALPAATVALGPPELAVAAGGIILNEIMLAQGHEEGASSRTVGFYSLHRRRRISVDNGPVGELAREVATRPEGTTAAFAGRKLIMVGAGALGNWSVIPMALESPQEIVIYDGDSEVAPHNVNRQILLVGGVGQSRSKVEVLTEALVALDPAGSYRGIPSFVRQAEDLAGLDDADALLCVPDNDETRLVCDEARRRAAVPFATAGSSGVGGQVIVRRPGEGCLRCLGLNGEAMEEGARGQSCALVQNDAVVSSNMVTSGIMISELREALAGREPANIRFVGDSRRGNRLARMISRAACTHVAPAQLLAS